MKNIDIHPIKEPNKLINYWLNCKEIIIFLIFFGTTYNVLTVIGPIFQGKLIDILINRGDLPSVLRYIIYFLSIILLIQITRFFKRFYVRRFANITSGTMRLMIYNNIINKNLSSLNNDSIGNLMTTVVSDVDICVEGMRKGTTELFDTGVLMLSYLVSLFYYDAKLTLIACIFIPIAMFIAEKLKTPIYKYSKAYRKKSSEITELTYHNISHTIVFRINGVESQVREDYFNNLDDLQSKAIKANVLENSMQPIYNVISLLGIVFLIYFGGKNVINDLWTVGRFSTYMIMFTGLSTKASKACKLFNSTQKASISWKRIKPYLTSYTIKELTPIDAAIAADLKIDNLSFSYGKDNIKPIIKNLSLYGKPGEIIGITGPVASGKSSLGIALLGIYDYAGSIKINNKELKYYTDSERSNLIAYHGHKSELLSDTIYNNIALGDDIKIDKILKTIDFNKDLESMEDGFNTLVGDNGIKLSGGQKARISLARALKEEKPLIILDDPFSAVDITTEKIIFNNIKKSYKNSIIILISHRLTVFPYLDTIIMLNSNHTYAKGTHDELLTSCKEYHKIYNLQGQVL